MKIEEMLGITSEELSQITAKYEMPKEPPIDSWDLIIYDRLNALKKIIQEAQ